MLPQATISTTTSSSTMTVTGYIGGVADYNQSGMLNGGNTWSNNQYFMSDEGDRFRWGGYENFAYFKGAAHETGSISQSFPNTDDWLTGTPADPNAPPPADNPPPPADANPPPPADNPPPPADATHHRQRTSRLPARPALSVGLNYDPKRGVIEVVVEKTRLLAQIKSIRPSVPVSLNLYT